MIVKAINEDKSNIEKKIEEKQIDKTLSIIEQKTIDKLIYKILRGKIDD